MTAYTALATGTNRGIGLEACRQLARVRLQIILTGRDAPLVQAAATQITREASKSIPSSSTWPIQSASQDAPSPRRLFSQRERIPG